MRALCFLMMALLLTVAPGAEAAQRGDPAGRASVGQPAAGRSATAPAAVRSGAAPRAAAASRSGSGRAVAGRGGAPRAGAARPAARGGQRLAPGGRSGRAAVEDRPGGVVQGRTSAAAGRGVAALDSRYASAQQLCPRGGKPARGGRCRGAGAGEAGGGRGLHWQAGLPPADLSQRACPDGTLATLARGHDDVVRCVPL